MTGLNDYGQLGIQRNECRQEFFPRILSQQPEEIKSIKTGIFHSLLLSRKLKLNLKVLESGNVYAMGDNSFGQLGIGHNNFDSGRGEEREFDIREKPTRIENL